MADPLKRFDFRGMLRQGHLQQMQKRYDLAVCIDCRRIVCLGKRLTGPVGVVSYIRHYRCPDCRVFSGLMELQIPLLLVVVKLKTEIMAGTNPYAKAAHLKTECERCLRHALNVQPTVTFLEAGKEALVIRPAPLRGNAKRDEQ